MHTYTPKLRTALSVADGLKLDGDTFSFRASSADNALARAVDCVLDNAVTNRVGIGSFADADHVLDTYEIDISRLREAARTEVVTRLNAWLERYRNTVPSLAYVEGEEAVVIDAP